MQCRKRPASCSGGSIQAPLRQVFFCGRLRHGAGLTNVIVAVTTTKEAGASRHVAIAKVTDERIPQGTERIQIVVAGAGATYRKQALADGVADDPSLDLNRDAGLATHTIH